MKEINIQLSFMRKGFVSKVEGKRSADACVTDDISRHSENLVAFHDTVKPSEKLEQAQETPTRLCHVSTQPHGIHKKNSDTPSRKNAT